MKFHANYGDAEALQLKAALLLYGGSKGISFASVHEPLKDQFGAPYLNSGRPVTMEFLRTLAQQLRRIMFFDANRDGRTLSGKSYPHPPLVFSLDGCRRLAVRALLANERPGRNSQTQSRPTRTRAPMEAYAWVNASPAKRWFRCSRLLGRGLFSIASSATPMRRS